MRAVRTTIAILAALLFAAFSGSGQTVSDIMAGARDSVSAADTVETVRYMSYDALMNYLKGQIKSSGSFSEAMDRQVVKNRGRRTQGYRLRIYFDNSQNARAVSERIVDTFKVRHPGVPVYRIYDNPYFKVTVGEFRSKSDAMRFLEFIRPEYPAVFLVKEFFSTI